MSSPSGRYVFDDLQAGTYSVRFAGVPEDFRLTPAGAGDQRAADSDPDYSGVTPPFTLGVGEPNVRPTTATDGVAAAYINPTIDAGITPLRYAVGDRVWLDQNSDGIQQSDEPAASATVSLLSVAGNVVATTTTDATGRYQFSNLRGGQYRLQFTHLPPNRAFTGRAAGTDPALDSDPDPVTGSDPGLQAGPGSAQSGADYRRQCRLHRLRKPDSERWSGNAGIQSRIGSGSTRTAMGCSGRRTGAYRVSPSSSYAAAAHVLATDSDVKDWPLHLRDLPAGNYQIRFSKVPHGLMFTSQDAGARPSH